MPARNDVMGAGAEGDVNNARLDGEETSREAAA